MASLTGLQTCRPGPVSSGSALTSCIMSRTVHRCPCVSDTMAPLWDLQWLPLRAGERGYSTDCLA